MLRRTKIVATLGPATDAPGVLESIIKAGVDVVRINFSHGADMVHARVNAVRECAEKLGKQIGIMGDLQGPKIRVSRFQKNKILLETGAQFILDADLAINAGTDISVGIDYKGLVNDVFQDDTLLLDDGRIVLIVKKIDGQQIICQVVAGGELSNNKGINRLGGGLSANALTEKDKEDIKTAAETNMDYVAVSFPRDANDMLLAKQLLREAGSNAGTIAKIERAEAIPNIDAIILASDGVMVARGDLAVEIGEVEVPAAQKHIINRARALNKPVITATQMMESMIKSPIPTRAEVSDVANAVLDQTDAVMLSAESAIGIYPEKVVETMARICVAAEKDRSTQASNYRVEVQFSRIDEAIAMAAIYTANHLGIRAIIGLTESGDTPLMMSRLRTGIPIYGLSNHLPTLGKMTLYRDVYPLPFDNTHLSLEETDAACIALLKSKGFVNTGDIVLFTKGDHTGIHGGTNTLKIIQIQDY